METQETECSAGDAATAVVTPKQKEVVSEAPSSPEPSKETGPDVATVSSGDDTLAATSPPEESNTESKSSEDEQRRVAERNEKNSKEHSKMSEPDMEIASNSSASPENLENHVDGDDPAIEKQEPVIKKCQIELKYKYREGMQ